MNDNLRYALLVDRYVNGEMNKEEIMSFEEELQKNKGLQANVQLENDLNTVLAQKDILEFRQKMAEVMMRQKEIKQPAKTFRLTSRRIQLAAASIIILILVSASLFLFLPRQSSNTKLFEKYYDSDRPVHVTRSGDVDLVEALRNYQQKNYEEAILLFNDVLITDPNNSAIRFYTGISFIETEKFTDAISCFQEIIRNNHSLYVEPAEWHLGLSYLRNGDEDLAVAQFKKVAADDISYYNSKATKILEQMNSK